MLLRDQKKKTSKKKKKKKRDREREKLKRKRSEWRRRRRRLPEHRVVQVETKDGSKEERERGNKTETN